jgi:indolepyruvate ferredoxin oxidoreductase
VLSHIHIGGGEVSALKIAAKQADLVIACDELVGNSRDVMAAIDSGHTFVIANANVSITGDFMRDPISGPNASLLGQRLEKQCGEMRFSAHPFTQMAVALLGEAIGANLMMLGFAWQRGWIGFDVDALSTAIEINATAVDMNKAAFAWGRRLAVDESAVYAAANLLKHREETLESIVAGRSAFLASYQNEAYAAQYCSFIDTVHAAEAQVSGATALSMAVARSLFKLMAYKDEYEVARLYTDGHFTSAVRAQFQGSPQLEFHLSPPIFARRDRSTGYPRKYKYGVWMIPVFRALAGLRRVRGTRLDPFGYSAERRMERQLITQFKTAVEHLLNVLSEQNLPLAISLAKLPMDIRGYGPIKDAARIRYERKLANGIRALSETPGEMHGA